MNRRSFLVTDKVDLEKLDALLLDGWVPEKAYSTDLSYLLLLVLPEDEDVEEKRPGEFDDVTDVISVEILNNEKIQERFREGYRVHEIYAKNVVMVRRAIQVQVTA
jgi:hypothetical protein